eukprot:6858660-Ditylum_brightwellii.AAC.1
MPISPPTISKNVLFLTQPHQTVHPTASTRVNIPHSTPINTNNVPGMKQMSHQTERTHGNTRVPSTPIQTPHLNKWHQQTHPRPKANMPHVIPPTEDMSPPNILPMYIPAPKGWMKIYPHEQQQPHVIPPCLGIKLCNDIQGKYVQALQHVLTMEIIANAVINKET